MAASLSKSPKRTDESWEQALINAITSPEELLSVLELDRSLLPAALKAAQLFPLKVPRGFVENMEKGNSADPLLRQVMPLAEELIAVEGYTKDPLQEVAVNPLPGLLHKYQSRVLLTFVGSCAINCRYCFRRHFSYTDNNPGLQGWERPLSYIANDPTIREVILSGGDPLVASDRYLRVFTEKLANISHVKRLRIHSRIPIVLPERISSGFLDWLASLTQHVILVVHCNHPNEISSRVKLAMQQLSKAGVTLLNQTVLLKGINDSVSTLAKLSETLFEVGILPYYLHAFDKIDGGAHLDMGVDKSIELHKQLSECLSGYLVPKLVYEKAGAPAKMNLNSGVFFTDVNF